MTPGIKKTVLSAIVAVALTAGAMALYPGFFATEENYPSYTIRYTGSNSLPPPDHLELMFVISKYKTGEITAEYTTQDYGQILDTVPVTVSPEQFEKLMNIVAIIRRETIGTDGSRCAPPLGGATKSIKVLKKGKVLLEEDGYNCPDAPDNRNFAELFAEVEKLLLVSTVEEI